MLSDCRFHDFGISYTHRHMNENITSRHRGMVKIVGQYRSQTFGIGEKHRDVEQLENQSPPRQR